MNTRKILCICTIIAVVLLALGITHNISIGSEDGNTYTMSATKTSVVKDDIVDVTLKVNAPKTSRGTQGRIEYNSNLELLSYEETNDYDQLSVQTDTDRCLVGFSTASTDPESGELTAVKLKFKVTGLEGGNYKVAWTDYDSEGNFNEISSVTLNRTDILVPEQLPNTDDNAGTEGTDNGTNNGSGTSIEDIIDAEINGETVNSGNDSQGTSGSSSGTGTSGAGTTSSSSSGTGTISSSNGGSTFIPQTGENTYLIVAIVSGVLMGICVYIRIKKMKF